MITSKDIKQYFKSKGLNVRVRTIPCKAKWMEAWIQSVGDHRTELKYNQEFPEDLREQALIIIYGPKFIEDQRAKGYSTSSAGNVNKHSISMVPAQWEMLLEWDKETKRLANLDSGSGLLGNIGHP